MFVPIEDIKIGNRLRKELGNLKFLAKSIESEGLLVPIGIDEAFNLVYGERRLTACRDILGMKEIECRLISYDYDKIMAEISENVWSLNFAISEMVAIIEKLRDYRRGGDRRSKEFKTNGMTKKQACEAVGWSEDKYDQALAVLKHGEDHVIQKMDRGDITVHAAYQLGPVKNKKGRYNYASSKMKGFFYLVESGAAEKEGFSRVKMGFTTDLKGRLKHYRTHVGAHQFIETWKSLKRWEQTIMDLVVNSNCFSVTKEIFEVPDVSTLIQRIDVVMRKLHDAPKKLKEE